MSFVDDTDDCGNNDVIVNVPSQRREEGEGASAESDSSLLLTAASSQPQQPCDYDGDDRSGELSREYDGKFEGPEKTLEVCFRKIQGVCGRDQRFSPGGDDDGDGSQSSGGCDEAVRGGGGGGCAMRGDDPDAIRRVGLRRLPRSDLDRVCARARCEILSRMSNRYLDAYVLSESSLFVYPYMIVLKTCGTTTLLRCVAVLVELGRGLGLEIDWLGYSRKNFNFPGDQSFPHGSFMEEMEYLRRHRTLCDRLNGNGYTLGPVTSDHWFVFVADHTARYSADLDTDRVLNIMMFDIDESVARVFYYDKYDARGKEETEDQSVRRISEAQTKAAGIDALVPGASIDPRAFEPCGYSMNAVLFRSYSTVHVTPEAGSSYASFETNQKLKGYASLLENVVRAFRPRRFVVTLAADEGGLAEMGDNALFAGNSERAKVPAPFAKARSGGTGSGGGAACCYRRSNLASIQVETDVCCMMGNWVLDEGSVPTSAAAVGTREEKRLRCPSFPF